MNENVQKWLDALRSGEFEQTQGYLQKDGGYCCLGVACEIYQRETGKGSWVSQRTTDAPHFVITDGNDTEESLSLLPETVKNWLGLRTEAGDYDGAALTENNDSGATFEEIADIVEHEFNEPRERSPLFKS